MSNLRYSESVVIGRTPDELYDMVADVTRMGEWSPICTACWWDDGDGPRTGAWFTGRNELPERTWETRSQVVAAEPGREFAFVVGGAWVRWGYTFAPVAGGTEVTEYYELEENLPLKLYWALFGKARGRTNARNMETTLERIKAVAEG